MDKVELTARDIELLLQWRDGHKDEVRSHPTPIRAVEIVILDNGYRIKAVRNGGDLRIGLNIDGKSIGSCIFQRREDGMFVAPEDKLRLDVSYLHGCDKHEVARSMLTVYCSLMAFIVFGSIYVCDEELAISEKHEYTRAPHKPYKRRSSGTTYIIKKLKYPNPESIRGHHASPKGYFSVRGHYRHYKSGKVVWIHEYMKGDKDRKKNKKYKLGTMNNEE